MTDAILRCAKEQAVIGEGIRATAADREHFGLRLGAQDWLKEEAILEGSDGIEDTQ